MVEYPASDILTVALISISLIGLLFGTLVMSMTFKTNSSLGHLMGQSNTMPTLKAVGIITDSNTLILMLGIDQTCKLISPCQLSSSLYVQEGKQFHSAVVTALNTWFLNLGLPPEMRQECLDSAGVQEWKKVRRVDSDVGDLMCANAHSSGRDVRNSSYIRVFSLFFLISLPLTVS